MSKTFTKISGGVFPLLSSLYLFKHFQKSIEVKSVISI